MAAAVVIFVVVVLVTGIVWQLGGPDLRLY